MHVRLKTHCVGSIVWQILIRPFFRLPLFVPFSTLLLSLPNLRFRPRTLAFQVKTSVTRTCVRDSLVSKYVEKLNPKACPCCQWQEGWDLRPRDCRECLSNGCFLFVMMERHMYVTKCCTLLILYIYIYMKHLFLFFSTVAYINVISVQASY